MQRWESKNVNLVQLSRAVLEALAAGDLAAANLAAAELPEPIAFGAYFAGPDWRTTWWRRVAQVADNPTALPWITRAVVDVDCEVVVGRAGFHGPPDTLGMVEVGYAIDPAFRRQGYARAALVRLLRWAEAEPEIRRVRATVHPDNVASLALIAQFGFTRVGEQWDEEDGSETVFEVDARRVRPLDFARGDTMRDGQQFVRFDQKSDRTGNEGVQ